MSPPYEEDDNHYDDYRREDYEEKIRVEAVADYRMGAIVSESAQAILNFLPIRRNSAEEDYINHLWQVFIELDGGDETARSFAMMPFHLLFMTALQYKVLRIAKTHKQASDLFFSGVGGRSKAQLLSAERSVFDIASINERTIPEIFQLVGLDGEVIKGIKALVDERNDNLAHAKGGIERNVEEKIDEYIGAIDSIHKCCLEINEKLASDWLSELDSEDDLKEFVEIRLLGSYLCPTDFDSGLLKEHFSSVVNQ